MTQLNRIDGIEDLKIFKNFAKHISLNELENKLVLSVLEEKRIRKKELVMRQSQYCRKIYFVEEGSLRAFNVNDDGKESTIMFAVSDWWITDMDSFMNQAPSNLSIMALEDSKILTLEYDKLQMLFAKVPKFERFFRILFQNAYIREQRRAFHNISMTTEERYLQFVNNYPAIVEKITQKQIASYLGITPEFLSAIKKKQDS